MSKDLDKAVSDAETQVLKAQREETAALKSKDQARISAAKLAVKKTKRQLNKARTARVRAEAALARRSKGR